MQSPCTVPFSGCRGLSYLYLSKLGRPSAVQKLLENLEDVRSVKAEGGTNDTRSMGLENLPPKTKKIIKNNVSKYSSTMEHLGYGNPGLKREIYTSLL